MKNSLFIIIFIGIFLVIKALPYELTVQEVSTLLVGVMLLTSYLFSNIIKKYNLPKLTGYMIMGVILGPSGLQFINNDIIDNLQFLENLALSFIALAAGGELKFSILKNYKKSLSLILISQLFIIFFGMVILFSIIAQFLPFLSGLSNSIIIGFAILFAGTALSTSPATAIGIITEVEAKGKITNIILAITVLKAIFLILVFPIVISASKILIIDSASFDSNLIKEIFIQLLGSVALGIIIGFLIIWYLNKIKLEISLFLLGLTLVITEVSSLFGLEILLTSMVAGIVVQNFSKQGQSFISGIEIFSLPIFVIFFCFAGASLHMEVLSNAITITLSLVVIRFGLNYAGNYVGSVLAKEDDLVKNVSWMGYIGQAGIALGLGVIIQQNLPGELGNYFLTILISTVVINEMIGPILLKYTFLKSNEAGIKG